MKHLLFLIAVFFCCNALWSASQSGDFSTINSNQGIGIIAQGNTSLYLQGLSSLPSNVVEFGYYYMDSKYNATGSGSVIDLNAIAKNNGLIGTFNKGDVIGFWMKTDSGSYLDSMHVHNGVQGDDRNAAYINNSGSGLSAVIGAGGYGSGYSPVKEDSVINDDFSFVFDVSNRPFDTTPSAPSGQPLPGVLLCFGAGVVIYGYLHFRRKTAAATSAS